MPRGKYVRKPKVVAEVEVAAQALEVAKADAAVALEAAAEAGSNKFIQEQAKQLLERVEADKAARVTEEPSGVEVVVDYNFLRQDPTDHTPKLAQHGVENRKDRRYHWINRDPRRSARRTNQGWLPVAGGSITNGDSVLASMPESKAKQLDMALAERRRIQQTAHIDRLEAEGQKTGMPVFTGNKSLRDGLD